MHAHSQRDRLAERLADLSARLEKADDFFAHHQGLTNGEPCPVKSCAACKKGDPPYKADHPTFRSAADRVDAIVRELGELTGIAWSLGYQWDGLRLVPYGDERPDPPFDVPQTALPFTTTQVQDLSEME